MSILVIGDKGQLGSELLRQIACDVRGCDLPEADITDLSGIRGIIRECQPHVVINCAAYTNVDRCEDDRDGAYRVNALGARNVAMACEDVGAKLIHVSTDYVFDGEGDTHKREWDIPAPSSVYGYTKLAGERMAQTFCSRAFIVRTAWLYGYAGGNFVKTILNAARAGKPLKVVDDQIGNPTNAADLAAHLLKLCATEEYGVYHCTNNGECSWYDFASAFLRLSGLEYTIESCATSAFPRPAKRPAYSGLDNMMLRLTVGDDMRPWQDAIVDFMTHYDRETGEFTP